MSLRQKVKGCQTALFFDKADEGLDAAMLLNQPAQAFLNAPSAAEASTTAFVQAICATPKTVVPNYDVHAVHALRANAMERNLELLNGTRIDKTLAQYFDMLNSYDASGWNGFCVSPGMRFDMCSSIVIGVCDLWRRLKFNLALSKDDVLGLGIEPESSGKIDEVADTIAEKKGSALNASTHVSLSRGSHA